MSDSKNRRNTARKKPKSSAKVECRRGSLGLGANLAVRLLDISEIGMGIILTASVAIKEEVEVVVTDHGQNKPFKHTAKVRRCEALADGTYSVGLVFEKTIPYADICVLAKP